MSAERRAGRGADSRRSRGVTDEHAQLTLIRAEPDAALADELAATEPPRNRGHRRAARSARVGQPTQRQRIVFVPSDELLREAPIVPSYQWEPAAVRGAVTLFGKKPKAGGSTFTYALIEATGCREPTFLGGRLHGGPVIYASEEGRATLGVTFPRHPDIHLLTRESVLPKPTWRELVNAAAEKAAEVAAVLVVIDTFAYFNGLGPDGEKDAGAVQPLLDALSTITHTGAAVWLAHHHRKAGGEDGDALRGTTAIAGGVDCFCELERIPDAPANHRRLVVTPRWDRPPVLILAYDENGYRAIGQAADREQSSDVGWTDRLLAAIPVSGEGVTLTDLAKLLGADRRKWHGPLATLIENGTVTRTGAGNRYDPYRHLRAAVPSSRPASEDAKDGSHAVEQPSCRIHTAATTAAASHPQQSDGTAAAEIPEGRLAQ